MCDCEFGHYDCCNTEQCHLCFNGSKYKAPKKKQQGLQKNYNKQTKRKGAISENIAQQQNQATIDNICSSRLTINSGAGSIEKGDALIQGIVRVMQEVKTQLPTRAKGCKSFSIQKEHLEKLHREAKASNQEFWWLIFSFKEDDKQQYAVVENQIMQDILANLINDRKIAKESNDKIELANKQRKLTEAINLELEAKINKLQIEIDYLKKLLEIKESEKDD